MSQKQNDTETKISPKHKYHHNENVTKTQISPKYKCLKTQMSPKLIYHKNRSLPNGSSTTRCPGLVHIYPNGLPGHGLFTSDNPKFPYKDEATTGFLQF